MQLPFQYDEKKFIDKPIVAVSDEGLLWVKINDRDAYMKIGQHGIEKTLDVFSGWKVKFPNAQEQYDDYSRRAPEIMRERMAAYDKIFADRIWIAKSGEELERRKAANTEILRSYGLPL